MGLDLFNNDLHVNGTLSAKSLSIPDATIGNAAVKSDAAIAATKVVHQFNLAVSQQPGTAIVAETRDVRILRAAGTVVGFEGAITGSIATGNDRTVTVDLQKGNAGAAFATILTATLSFSDADVLRTTKSAAIASPDVADNDILRVVVTVAGAAGNQAQGLAVSVTLREEPQ